MVLHNTNFVYLCLLVYFCICVSQFLHFNGFVLPLRDMCVLVYLYIYIFVYIVFFSFHI